MTSAAAGIPLPPQCPPQQRVSRLLHPRWQGLAGLSGLVTHHPGYWSTAACRGCSPAILALNAGLMRASRRCAGPCGCRPPFGAFCDGIRWPLRGWRPSPAADTGPGGRWASCWRSSRFMRMSMLSENSREGQISKGRQMYRTCPITESGRSATILRLDSVLEFFIWQRLEEG
jgi:hypothetical protein